MLTLESAIATVAALAEGLATLFIPPKTALYAELRPEFEAASEAVAECRGKVAAQLQTARAFLDEKMLHRATA
jgi:hypothetical protein